MTGGFHGLCLPLPISARDPRASNTRASSWFLPEVPCPLMGAGQEGSPRGGARQPRTLWQGRKPSPALKVSPRLLELASFPSCLIPRSRVLPQINCTPQILFSLEIDLLLCGRHSNKNLTYITLLNLSYHYYTYLKARKQRSREIK